MKNTDYEIKSITKGTAERFLMQHHHLAEQGNSTPSGPRYYGLFFESQIIGVTIFTTMSSQNTAKGCFGLDDTTQQGFYEIGRFAVDPDFDTAGCGTWFLAECIARFRHEFTVRALFVYNDPDLEDGAPFLENDFACYGLTPKRTDFYEEMEDGSFRKCSRGKPQSKGEWRPRPRKHRLLRTYDKELTTRWIKTNYPISLPNP